MMMRRRKDKEQAKDLSRDPSKSGKLFGALLKAAFSFPFNSKKKFVLFPDGFVMEVRNSMRENQKRQQQ